jgi:hypothetical protein
VQQRALARAGGPHDRQQLAVGDLGVDAAQRADGAGALAEGLDEAAGAECRNVTIDRHAATLRARPAPGIRAGAG